MTDTDQVNQWTDFFQDKLHGYTKEISHLIEMYPEEMSLEVDYWRIQKWNDEFAEKFLERPRLKISDAEKAIAQEFPAEIPDPVITLRVYNLPSETARIPMNLLRTEHIEKYISIEGMVQSRTEVRPRLTAAIFMCQKCGFKIRIPQEDNVLREPYKCVNENCDREAKNTSFPLIKTVSDYDDLQIINLSEPLGDTSKPKPPHILRIYVRNDLCGKVNPGERITVNGILFTSQKKASNTKTTDFDLFLDGFSIESQEITFEEIEITAVDKQNIHALSKNPEISSLIRDSIAPNIFEMDIIKEALSLQLFGGVGESSEANHQRGDIHILLVGDAGLGKSQLLRAIAHISPRGVFTSGRGSSEGGLTAVAVKDEFDGRWVLEAGAMVLANKGILCADEIDKMRKNDRTAMHPGMEQQVVPISKGGIHTTLPTECAVLGAANPKGGRFTDDKLYVEQINLPPTLLSRFDLIFPMIDRSNTEKDRTLARQIIKCHRATEMRQSKENASESLSDTPAPKIELDLLRKYIAYSKRNIFPIMSEPVMDHILDYYVKQRESNKTGLDEECEETERRTITPRQLEGLIRLSEASARLRLSNEVTITDFERATRLFNEYMNQVARDKSGRLDIDTIMSGTTARKRNFGKIIRQSIEINLSNPDIETSNGVHITDIHKQATASGMGDDEIETTLKTLLRDGAIFVPSDDYYLVVN